MCVDTNLPSFQDYPSISQIASKVADRQVSVIFAVKQDQVSLYRQLEEFIPNSAVGELANDSSNIVRLIKDNYQACLKTYASIQKPMQSN